MTSQMAQLQAQPRSILGKQVKRLRLQGLTPIHLYGRGIPSVALQADSASLEHTLIRVGRNQPVSLEVHGHEHPYIAIVRDIQFHPLSNAVVHVDFLGVEVSRAMEVEVPISFEGEAPAARRMGGSLFQALHTIRVEALPLEIPQSISVDLSALDDFDKSIRVGDLSVPPGVTILTEGDQLVARVTPPVAGEVAGEAAGTEEAPQAEAQEAEA